MTVRFVVSTRRDANEFFSSSLLALSLENLSASLSFRLEPAFQATQGLAAVYNPAIARSADDDLLVFLHDDVYIDDWYCCTRLTEALARYDVIGLAGCGNRIPGQTSWFAGAGTKEATPPAALALSGGIKHIKLRPRKSLARFLDSGIKHLSFGRRDWQKRWTRNNDGSFTCAPREARNGTIRSPHAGSGAGNFDFFGATPAPAKLLDGALLAARADRLRASGVRFDPRFRYHFYDLDFCRQCEAAGLSMGTWPLAVAHGSTGSWGDDWRRARNIYLDKWKS